MIDWKTYAEYSSMFPISALALRAACNIEGVHSPRALDMGAGGLRDAQGLVRRGITVDAVDCFPGFTAQNVGELKELIHLHSGSVCGLDIAKIRNSYYDIVLSNFTLPYIQKVMFPIALRRLISCAKPKGIVAFNVFGEKHENHDEPNVLRHKREEVAEMIDVLLRIGCGGILGEPICSEFLFESEDWKGRHTQWHYFDIFLYRK